MSKLQTKILTALKTNKLNPNKLGERKWYNYFISVTELVWARNFVDGYCINIYSDEYKTEHLATYTSLYDIFKNEDVLQVNYEKEWYFLEEDTFENNRRHVPDYCFFNPVCPVIAWFFRSMDAG